MAKDVLSDLNFGGVARATNLPNPSAAGDAATKSYVDSAVEGLAWKDSARVATSANINLASPGASIDGVALSAGDRVLLRGQTAGAQNGVYLWNGAAAPMTRAPDASTAAELEQAILTVEEGTSAGASFRQTSVNFVLDTGAVAWQSFGVVAAPATDTNAGVAEIATQAETDAGADDARFVTPAKLAGYVGRKLKLSQDVGDGSATQFTVTHNFNSRDVHVEVFRNSGAYDSVLCDVDRPSANAVRLTFAAPPAANAFRAVVLG